MDKSNSSPRISTDPFASCLQDESALSELEQQELSGVKEDSTDAVNVSIGSTEVNLLALATDSDRKEVSIISSFVRNETDAKPRYRKMLI